MEDMQVNIVQKAGCTGEWYAANFDPVTGVFPTREMAENFIEAVPGGEDWMSIVADNITGDFLVLGVVPGHKYGERLDPKH